MRAPRASLPGRHRAEDDSWLVPVEDYDPAQRAAYETAQRAAYDRMMQRASAQRDRAMPVLRPQQPAAPLAARVMSPPRERVRGMNAALESGIAGVGELAPARRPIRPRQLILAVLLAFAGVAAGVLTYKSLASTPVSLGGQVVPTQVYPVSFGATGTINAVKIQPGQQVTAGEVLATQDGTLAEANLQEAHAAAAAAAAALFADQHPAPGVVVMPAAVALAQQRLAAARAQVAQDALALKETEVVAPAAGIVGAVWATAGTSITASNLHSPVVTIDSGPLVVSAHLPGTEVGSIRVGQPVTLAIEPLHVSLPGRVLRFSQVQGQSQGAVSYVVFCHIDARDAALLAGMAADIIPR